MYGFYGLLWWNVSQPLRGNHHGDRALGVAIAIIFTTPFYLLFNLIFAYRGYKKDQRKVFFINVLGLLLCILNFSYLYYKTNGFS